ncbi:hypothetical protein HYH03_013621 [Edaphochlamys debaryana]|nr:hypothetical protein HYH03_013621 [Edaphochlamys debaryana]|eukprot:KAG2487776.1 hypothetical protein HYH03_013621 [Edaphochlamys debaryana]
MIREGKRKEVREKAKGVHHTKCPCGGKVYFMGSLCFGLPTGNGYSEADEYTCGTCLREFSGHVATYRD